MKKPGGGYALAKNETKDFCPECDYCIPNGSAGRLSGVRDLSGCPTKAPSLHPVRAQPPALQGAFVASHQRHQAFLFHQSRVTSRGPFDPFDKAPCLV